MSTEVLIAIQVLVFLLLVIGMMALLVKRQKKTIAQLQSILTDVKDDISGDNLLRHLQSELNNTAAHCRQDTIALKPDLTAEDMAISLRYTALQSELAVVQRIANNPPWREQIKSYEELAKKLFEFIQAKVDHITGMLKENQNEELAVKDQAFSILEKERSDLQSQLKKLKPLLDFIDANSGTELIPEEIEKKLHRALLELCENFTKTEKIREVVFLLHEAFNDKGARNENTMMQFQQQAEAEEQSDFELDTEQAMADNLDAEAPASFQVEELQQFIDQIIEETAVMIERMYMLTNENKQLKLENDQMQQEIMELEAKYTALRTQKAG